MDPDTMGLIFILSHTSSKERSRNEVAGPLTVTQVVCHQWQLLAATGKRDLTQVKALLDKGANINAKTLFACDRGKLDMVKLLIERGVNVKDNFYNATLLT